MVAPVIAAVSLSTGLYGHVTRGPLTPVCQVGTPCDGPAKAAIFYLVRGDVRLRIVTDNHGDYRRSPMRPGLYIVRVDRRSGVSIRPVAVRVGALHRQDFRIDTGIR